MSNTLKFAAVLGNINDQHVPTIVTGAGSWDELRSQHGDIFPMVEVDNPPVADEKAAEKLVKAIGHTCGLAFVRGFAAICNVNAGGKGKKLSIVETVPVEKVTELLAKRRGDFDEHVAKIVTQKDLVREDGTIKPTGEIGVMLRTILPANVNKLLPTAQSLKPKVEKPKKEAKPKAEAAPAQ